MTNWQNDLPPIARERLARIGELTGEEKEKLADREKVDSLLSEFYRGNLEPESLWKRLREEDKPSLLRETQIRLVDGLSLGAAAGEMHKRREGVLAIETLKEDQNTSVVELNLNLLENLQKSYRGEIEQAYNSIKAEVERNPQLRVKQVQQGQNTALVQLTVDEAIKQLPQWQEFLSRQDKRYSQEFARLIEKLKTELR